MMAEAISKVVALGFRPLDGESFSKLKVARMIKRGESFRPLDGESFSKL